MQEKKLDKIKNLILYFFMFSFVGWVFETLYAFMIFKTFVKRGFLYGPICPIYGFGAVILILINNLISKRTKSNVIKFFLVSAIFTVFEYLVSVIFELIFGIRWWDYTNEFLNFKGRICLMFSIIWGIFGLTFINCIYYPSKKLIEKLKKNISAYIINIILTIFTITAITDFVFSIIKYLK